MEDQITFCLRVSRARWNMFKKTVTRDRSLNTALNDMIEERINSILKETDE